MLACPLCRIVLFAGGPCPRDGHEGVEAPLRPVPTEVERRFRVLEPFAVGDSGTLYVADDGETGHRGLLKLLGPRDRSRVHRELLRQVQLRNAPRVGAGPRPGSEALARVWVAGESSGVPWFFREWLDGVSLAVRLSRDGPVPPTEAVSIAYAVAQGLDVLHRAGLVHRNVHPGHVMICPRPGSTPRVALLDAGIAAPAPGAGERVLGVPATLSPEVARGEPATFRSDLYALGCVLHHALTGKPPFTGPSPADVVAAQSAAPPPPPPAGLPPGLDALLASLLAKDPKDRPLSAQQLRRRLRPYLPEGGEDVREPTLAFDLRSHTGVAHPRSAPRSSPSAEGASGAPRAPSAPPEPAPPAPSPGAGGGTAERDDPTVPLHPEDLERVGASAPPEGPPTGAFGGPRWSTPRPPPGPGAPAAPGEGTWSGLTGRFPADESEPGLATPPPPDAPAEGPREAYTPPPPAGLGSQPPRSSGLPPAPSGPPPGGLDPRSSRSSSSGAAAAVTPPPPRGFPPAPSRPSSSGHLAGSRRPSSSGFTRAPTPPPSRWPPARKDAAPVAVFRPPTSQRPASAPAELRVPRAARLPDLGARDPAASGASRGRSAPVPSSIPPDSLPAPGASFPDRASSGPPASAPDPHAAAAAAAPSAAAPSPPAPSPSSAAGAARVGGAPPPSAASEPASGSSSFPPPPGSSFPPSRGSAIPPTATPLPEAPESAAPPTEEGLWSQLAAGGWLTLLGLGLLVFVASTTLLAWLAFAVLRWSATPPLAASGPAPVQDVAADGDRPPPPPADADDGDVAERPSDPPVDARAGPREDDPAAEEGGDGAVGDDAPGDDVAPARTEAAQVARPAPRPRRRATPQRRATREAEGAGTRAPASAGDAEPTSPFALARQEGRAHFAARRYAEAAEAYERATRLQPRHAGSFAGLGAARAAAGDVAGAVAAYERAVALSPRTSGFHAALGRVRLRVGDRAGAINAYQRALALDEGNAAARTALERLGVR